MYSICLYVYTVYPGSCAVFTFIVVSVTGLFLLHFPNIKLAALHEVPSAALHASSASRKLLNISSKERVLSWANGGQWEDSTQYNRNMATRT